MSDGHADRAGIGHNAPPVYRAEIVEAHAAKAADFLDAGGAWLDNGEISDEAQAGKLNDFIAGIKAVRKTVDADRKSDKGPHDEAGKQVQAAYTPILEKLDLAIRKVTPLMSGWLQREQDRQRREAEEKRRQAEEAARKAAEMAAKAEARNDISGESEAEQAAKDAARMAKEADRAAKATAKASSATGAGRAMSMRATWRATITNQRVAYMTFADHPEVAATLVRLAEARARSRDFDPTKDKIAGFDIHPERKAV